MKYFNENGLSQPIEKQEEILTKEEIKNLKKTVETKLTNFVNSKLLNDLVNSDQICGKGFTKYWGFEKVSP